MPCRDDYGTPATEYKEDPETIKKLDKVTALLCSLCTKLEGQELFNHILKNNKELNSWWINHQEKDRKEAKRLSDIKKKKLMKQKALSKLTL